MNVKDIDYSNRKAYDVFFNHATGIRSFLYISQKPQEVYSDIVFSLETHTREKSSKTKHILKADLIREMQTESRNQCEKNVATCKGADQEIVDSIVHAKTESLFIVHHLEYGSIQGSYTENRQEIGELLDIDRPQLPEKLKISSLARRTQQERTQIMLQLSKVQNHFHRYLQVGGFPELALADNDIIAQQIMREDVVDKVLKRDLPSLYNIRNATELERIFLYLCNVSSEIVSVEAITKELNGVSRPTVENYISYLESANLIYQSWPVSMADKQVLKARPKIYIADAAIRNAVLMDDSILTNPTEMGKIVETAIYKHVAAFYYQQATSVGYFRGGKKNKEIDIVVEYPNTNNILIEVKYRESAPIADDDAIAELCEHSSAAIIVTKNADDFGVHNTNNGHDMVRIPAFAFLYLLGHAEKRGYQGID